MVMHTHRTLTTKALQFAKKNDPKWGRFFIL